VLNVVELRDTSLSVSAVWGKHFIIDGQRYGHVIDPRTGWPARDAVLGAVKLPSAAVSDALSTAVLLAGDGVLEKLEASVPGLAYLRLSGTDGGMAEQSRDL
jgi:thiamine biosynthesis lipoprotein